MENITNLKTEGDDFRWYLKLKCENCGEETPDYVYLTASVGWIAEGTESGTPFSIDLSEKEWYDYDEKAGESVSISEAGFQFVHVKQ
ncbi:hypothetical protein C0Q70_16893 [Pomacea canaliculata]|uniref:DUF866 domain-containing protein n=1 Tax=Pomacea canaliculata TaxID=400727 RepID=A0A2T7NR24_POMCA|nr:hypothetical protein C0Q70_16893 [Pomacea canaliculata]